MSTRLDLRKTWYTLFENVKSGENGRRRTLLQDVSKAYIYVTCSLNYWCDPTLIKRVHLYERIRKKNVEWDGECSSDQRVI